MKNCFCGNKQPYSRCCAPLINGNLKAASPEELMRSRFSAYVMAAVDYLYETTHLSQRLNTSKPDIEQWAKSNSWKQLEVLDAEGNTVEFKAHYRSKDGKLHIHHEKSSFVFENDNWYYVDGIFGDDIKR
ncbi:MAG TPA: YchJ family metal-binding protein [Dyadobacter sp.]|jgi:SEC-C motif-containing protein|nr:YchJ family metal-binding protein [Dyadobacter sp.]